VWCTGSAGGLQWPQERCVRLASSSSRWSASGIVLCHSPQQEGRHTAAADSGVRGAAQRCSRRSAHCSCGGAGVSKHLHQHNSC
jgi:hypothetical protein